jgi:hypothetical protein
MTQETEPNPFLERPDEHVVGDELYCWMPGNGDRECIGSCVAYDPSYVHDQARDPCKALNAVRSFAKSVAMLVGHVQHLEKRAEVAARQAQASKLPDPPKV